MHFCLWLVFSGKMHQRLMPADAAARSGEFVVLLIARCFNAKKRKCAHEFVRKSRGAKEREGAMIEGSVPRYFSLNCKIDVCCQVFTAFISPNESTIRLPQSRQSKQCLGRVCVEVTNKRGFHGILSCKDVLAKWHWSALRWRDSETVFLFFAFQVKQETDINTK